mmetsp:Transcript_53325/g.104319  ORF Transcript_53325/g.104319 Transcript_53325/m.104319 type:complete len:203 (-) Transcript_53325:267-875(-)
MSTGCWDLRKKSRVLLSLNWRIVPRKHLRYETTAAGRRSLSVWCVTRWSHNRSHSFLPSTSDITVCKGAQMEVRGPPQRLLMCRWSWGSVVARAWLILERIFRGGLGKKSNQPTPQWRSTVITISNVSRRSDPNIFTNGNTKAGSQRTFARKGHQWARHESVFSSLLKSLRLYRGNLLWRSKKDGWGPLKQRTSKALSFRGS